MSECPCQKQALNVGLLSVKHRHLPPTRGPHGEKLTINGHFLDSRYIRGYVCREGERGEETGERGSATIQHENLLQKSVLKLSYRAKSHAALSPNCLLPEPSQVGMLSGWMGQFQQCKTRSKRKEKKQEIMVIPGRK